ncbi:MAG: holo-ACP synthase [Candidatus Caenarcaniphilales bacterium]|nr:holo-ACP synthase [Candidatus Caenarcaniphilales bacterium]
MPLRLGTDLCDPNRIEKVLRRYGKKFVNKILTAEEQEYLEFGFNQRSFKPSLSHRLAARYAAKEAVAKALGTGIGKEVAFHDILILKKEGCGAPYIKLENNAVNVAEKLGINKWEISISHEKAMSVAIVIGYQD